MKYREVIVVRGQRILSLAPSRGKAFDFIESLFVWASGPLSGSVWYLKGLLLGMCVLRRLDVAACWYKELELILCFFPL